MRTQAASRDSASHATKPLFGTRAAPAAAFFAPMVQAKKCAEEEPLPAPRQEISLVQPKCAACSEAPKWQTKLSIGAPGDRFENEADQVADAVMRAPAPGSLSLQASQVEPRRIQRDAAESCAVKDEPREEGEEDEETEDMEPMVDPEDAAATPVSPKRHPGEVSPPPDMEAKIDGSRGGGAALPNDTRDFMESRFGYDFSGVRVHTGANSENLNRGVRSLAFTSGADIYFGSGQYRPETETGKHLLAHELTHVVQQSGSATGSVVREKSDADSVALAREKKPYYGGGFSGTAYHGLIEKMLRDHDKELVTEAVIPGATRKDISFNLVGVADLYKSKPAHTVSGVKAFKDADTEERFLNMDAPDKRGTQPAVTSSPQLAESKKGAWQGDFPSEIWLGEIKPFSWAKLEAGQGQLYRYETGYPAFVRQAHKVNGGKTRPNLTTHRLKLDIPPFLDLDHWETQHAAKNVPSISGTTKNTRLWIGSAGDGVYLYAALPTEGGATAPKAYFDQIAEMRTKVLTPLKTPPKKTAKMMKFITPGTRLAISPAGGGSAQRIQRSTSERGPTYWSDQARDWEKARFAWGKKFREYAKGAELKPHRAKVRFEKALGRAGRTLKAGEKVEVRNYKQSMFWSGRAGKLLGRVRFLLGGAWDKALAIFETNKEKMDKVRTKLKGMTEPTLKFSWATQLIAAVVAVCKVAFTAFITESFNFFADCFHSAMEKVMKDFEEEMNEKFGEEICRYRKLFEDSKQKLEQEWGETIRLVTALVDAVQDVKYWMNIATLSVDLIRIGVQIVSCLTPPGLGCLWGLVAQLGIGAMVGIVVGTQWFNDTIITPNVRDLLRKYIGPEYQKLINRALGPGLSKYHCDIVKPIEAMDFKATGGLARDSAELRAHRDAWEAVNESEILKDLVSVFEKPGGKKVTRAELLELAKKVQDSKLSKDDLKKLLEQARNPESGKLSLDKAKKNAGKQEMPPASVAKARKIDYVKASEQNVVYQKLRGWDPMTFVRQPGLQVHCDEFADAVYDMQVALKVPADGILGDATLVAFYDRNKKKPDIFYAEAAKAIEQKKAAEAEKAAKEKAAKDKAAGDKAGLSVPPLPASVKVLNGTQVVPDTGQDQEIPKGINIDIVNFWSHVSWQDQPRDYSIKAVPAFVTLDIRANKKHEFRIEYVAVQRLYVAKMYGYGCDWTANLWMQDGIKVQTSNGLLVIRLTHWCLPS